MNSGFLMQAYRNATYFCRVLKKNHPKCKTEGAQSHRHTLEMIFGITTGLRGLILMS
jgi:hypothetical protein